VLFHPQLKKKGVTKQLLWQEYVERNTDNHYSYPQMCRIYREWLSRQQPSMRQTHQYGEKLFIDYCGPTIPIVNPETGECRGAQVFVAVMGGSNYTFAEATLSQQLEDWIMSHVRAFQFLGAVTNIIVPDNLRSATPEPASTILILTALISSLLPITMWPLFRPGPCGPRIKQKLKMVC
jgi:transposase